MQETYSEQDVLAGRFSALMDEAQKEILMNQLIIMNQLAVFYNRFDEVLKNAGERPLKPRHECRLMTDAVKRVRNFIKENE